MIVQLISLKSKVKLEIDFKATTKVHASFVSNYLNSTSTSWELEGIKLNPYGSGGANQL